MDAGDVGDVGAVADLPGGRHAQHALGRRIAVGPLDRHALDRVAARVVEDGVEVDDVARSGFVRSALQEQVLGGKRLDIVGNQLADSVHPRRDHRGARRPAGDVAEGVHLGDGHRAALPPHDGVGPTRAVRMPGSDPVAACRADVERPTRGLDRDRLDRRPGHLDRYPHRRRWPAARRGDDGGHELVRSLLEAGHGSVRDEYGPARAGDPEIGDDLHTPRVHRLDRERHRLAHGDGQARAARDQSRHGRRVLGLGVGDDERGEQEGQALEDGRAPADHDGIPGSRGTGWTDRAGAPTPKGSGLRTTLRRPAQSGPRRGSRRGGSPRVVDRRSPRPSSIPPRRAPMRARPIRST